MKDFDVHLLLEDKKSKNKMFSLNLTLDLKYFDGHFKDQPILAAVAQLHLVDRLIKAHFASNLTFQGMKQLKFMAPIVPGKNTVLQIQEKDGHCFGFEFKTADEVNSKGQLIYQGQHND